jgi:hypothetical protein
MMRGVVEVDVVVVWEALRLLLEDGVGKLPSYVVVGVGRGPMRDVAGAEVEDFMIGEYVKSSPTDEAGEIRDAPAEMIEVVVGLVEEGSSKRLFTPGYSKKSENMFPGNSAEKSN